MVASKLVGPAGHVYSFEPSPSTFSVLKRNVEDNGLKNVTIERKAVSDTNGTVELYESIPGVYRSPSVGKEVVVDSVKLDDYLRGADFVKIDVDGHETRALQGMTELLRGDLRVVMEYWPRGMAQMRIPQMDLLVPLHRLGFSFHTIMDDGSVALTSLSQLLEWGEHQARTANSGNMFDSRNIFLSKNASRQGMPEASSR